MILISARPFPSSGRLSPLPVLGSSASPVSPLPLSCNDQDPCHVLCLHIQSSKYWWSHAYRGSLLLLHLRKHFFTMRVVKQLGQVAQRCSEVPISGRIKHLTGHGPGQPSTADPAWAGRLTYMISRGLFQPQHFCNLSTSFLSCIWKNQLHLELF